MPESIDLEENTKEFLEYTADKTYGDLIALQGHLETLVKGEKVLFCLACCLKHEISLSKLADECIGGFCPNQPLWREIAEWATELKNEHIKLLREKKELKADDAIQTIKEAREYRKQMEKILVGKTLPETETYVQEHVS